MVLEHCVMPVDYVCNDHCLYEVSLADSAILDYEKLNRKLPDYSDHMTNPDRFSNSKRCHACGSGKIPQRGLGPNGDRDFCDACVILD